MAASETLLASLLLAVSFPHPSHEGRVVAAGRSRRESCDQPRDDLYDRAPRSDTASSHTLPLAGREERLTGDCDVPEGMSCQGIATCLCCSRERLSRRFVERGELER